ncbi:uncharacterized protein [Dermacentor albipictus]|uniref:uncharacterized protein n=1 Tax=Dermacentor albipictus TaxID=60249 RepID=UPI0038FCC181
MTDRSESPPRRLSTVNPNIVGAPVPVPSTTPHYSGMVSPPAYGVFAPYTMAAQNSYTGGQPALSAAYHYGPVPGAGVWQQQQQPAVPLAVPVGLPGLYRFNSAAPQPLPQPVFVRKETLADLTQSNRSSPRRPSARRSDKPYMLQKCGPFFAWQLLIMWMAVLGTVVYACSFGAFRHYLTEQTGEGSQKSEERPLKDIRGARNHRLPEYLNTNCGVHNPCRGIGLLCVGGHCVCGPDYEVQGELCGLKKNVVTEERVTAVTDVTVLPTSTPGGQSGNRSMHPQDPRRGVHRRHSLNKEIVHRQTTSTKEEFTFVIATSEYEDHAHKRVAPIRRTAVARDEATRRSLRRRPTKQRVRKRFEMMN